MRKRERQQLIAELINGQPLATQTELVAALESKGCRVTQATVSRDIGEMGISKGRDREGRVRYQLPPASARRDPEESLAGALFQSAASVEAAQNLVVIRAEPGTAPNLGRAVDELGHADIVGTVAGDDTVLLVLRDTKRARLMGSYLEGLARRR